VKPVVYRLRCVLRSRWRSAAGLAAVVAVVGAIVLAFGAGAQRTASTPERFTDARELPFEVSLQQERGRPRLDELRALAAVDELYSVTFVFGGLVPADAIDAEGKLVPDDLDRRQIDSLVFAGDYRAFDGRLVAGRDPDPSAPTEFVATMSLVAEEGLSLGDHLGFGSLTQEQADRAGFNFDDPAGPVFLATLVGIIDGPADSNDPSSRSAPNAIFGSSLLEQTDVGVATSIMGVHLAPDATIADLQAQVDGLAESESFILGPAELVGPLVRTAVNAQSRGLWILTAVSAIAAIAVLGQVITRQVRLSPAERSRLSAVGFTERQIIGETLGRAAASVVVGIVLAVVLALLVSDTFPTGFARNLEPNPGIRFETRVLVPGALLLVVGLLLWTAVAVAVRPIGRRLQPSPVVERIASGSPSPTAATGVRFAFIRGERDVGSVRTAVVGLLLTIVGLVAALTFAASLQRLVTDRDRYGENYDGFLGSGQTEVSDELLRALQDDPDIVSLTLLSEGQGRAGDYALRLIGMEPVEGNLLPPLLKGRHPSGDDEIALGRLAAKDLGVGIGDELTLGGVEGERTFRVTGLAVVPSIGSNDGVGQDGLLTIGGLKSLDPAVIPNTPIFDLRSGFSRETLRRVMTELAAADTGGDELAPEPPVAIKNIMRIRAIPYVLTGLLALLAILTVGHVMITSVHNRRRDVAIVRALGADRGWITRALHWQATSFTVLPIVVGVPLGLVVGHLVFRAFADSIGTINDASLPFVLIALLVIAVVFLANGVAALPARRARRQAPGVLLRAE
jgi:ABC-type antimicrobial peptide transport system permease subunit